MIFIRSVDCEGCAPCATGPCLPSPTPDTSVYFRSASASLSKCGFTEWPGYQSSPPKYFYYFTLSGTVTLSSYDSGCSSCVTSVEDRYYGSITVSDAINCVESGVPSVNEKVYQDCFSLYSDNTYSAYDVTTVGWVGDGFTESYTSTTHTLSGTNTCTSGNKIGTGTAYAYVSGEYTTGDLISNVTNILPSFSGPFSVANPATDYAYFDVSSDEVTATKTKMEYYIGWDSMAYEPCLKVTWSEKFEAEAGWVSYTSFTYSTSGSATWTGIYTIYAPTTEGKTTVVSVSITCRGC